MTVYTEYRPITALGVDQDDNVRWQTPEYWHWYTDEQEAREIYADIVGGPDGPLVALLSRRVTPWQRVNGPITPDGDLMPAYRCELWNPRTRGGEPQRIRVTVPTSAYKAAAAVKNQASHHGQTDWEVYARLESPITILEHHGTPRPLTHPAGHTYNLA